MVTLSPGSLFLLPQVGGAVAPRGSGGGYRCSWVLLLRLHRCHREPRDHWQGRGPVADHGMASSLSLVTCLAYTYVDFVARNRYLRQGLVITPLSKLRDVITNPCLRYLLMATKSSNVCVSSVGPCCACRCCATCLTVSSVFRELYSQVIFPWPVCSRPVPYVTITYRTSGYDPVVYNIFRFIFRLFSQDLFSDFFLKHSADPRSRSTITRYNSFTKELYRKQHNDDINWTRVTR